MRRRKCSQALMSVGANSLLVLALVQVASGQLGISENEVQPLNMPQITRLDVDCAKSGMTVNIEFSAPFNGVIFSKGFYANPSCRYVTTNSGQYDYVFVIPLTSCGTEAFSRLRDYVYDGPKQDDPSEKIEMYQNTLIIQQDERVQEFWDISRTINCEWQNNIIKTVTSNALNVQVLDSVSLRFAGDDAVDCWMDLQIGRWPQSISASSIVRIGEDLSILIYANDPRGKFDMHVKDCYASSSQTFDDPHAIAIQLTDYDGCIVKEKLIGPFVYTKTAGSEENGQYTLLAIAFLQAFKFPDLTSVYLTCNIEICKEKCDNPCQYFYENKGIENTTPSYPPYNPDGNRDSFSNDYFSSGASTISARQDSLRAPELAPSNDRFAPSLPHSEQFGSNSFVPLRGPQQSGDFVSPVFQSTQSPIFQNLKQQVNPIPVQVHPSIYDPNKLAKNQLPLQNEGNNKPQFKANKPQAPSRSILPPPIQQNRGIHSIPFTFASLQQTSPSPVYQRAENFAPLKDVRNDLSYADVGNHALNKQTFFPEHRVDEDGGKSSFTPILSQNNNWGEAHPMDAVHGDKQRLEEKKVSGFKPNKVQQKPRKRQDQFVGPIDSQKFNFHLQSQVRVRRTIDIPLNSRGEPESSGKVRVSRSIHVISPSDTESLSSDGNSNVLFLQKGQTAPEPCISVIIFSMTVSILITIFLGIIGYFCAIYSKLRNGKITLDIGGVTAYSKS